MSTKKGKSTFLQNVTSSYFQVKTAVVVGESGKAVKTMLFDCVRLREKPKEESKSCFKRREYKLNLVKKSSLFKARLI